MDEEYRKEIETCIEKSMQAENISKIKIDLTGTNKEKEGFLADLIFATVTGTDEDDTNKKFHLAIKIGKREKWFREKFPMLVACYKRESLLYDTVLPAFYQFQFVKNIVNIFDAIPKCYGTVLSNDVEALIMENMKEKGFVLHNRQLTMNLQHLQLILKNYAKFHALSLAFRDQRQHEFNKITANYYSVTKTLFPIWINEQTDHNLQKVLREAGRDDLYAKYAEKTKNQDLTVLLSILDDVPQESVIIHGDCHNDNFLFKYKDNDLTHPLGVAIIDWQLSGIHSPVLDLSHFLYWSASKKELPQMDELLKFYHSELADFMKQLASDAHKVFPYTTLVEHWRKYSIFGLILGKNGLQRFYIPGDFRPVFTGNKESDDEMWKDVKLENEDLYRERLISAIDHYFNFVLT